MEAGVLEAELRVRLEEVGHHPLVLLGGEGAGGVDQHPPRPQEPEAWARRAFCTSAILLGAEGPQWRAASLSLRNIPSPEQGASRRTRWK